MALRLTTRPAVDWLTPVMRLISRVDLPSDASCSILVRTRKEVGRMVTRKKKKVLVCSEVDFKCVVEDRERFRRYWWKFSFYTLYFQNTQIIDSLTRNIETPLCNHVESYCYQTFIVYSQYAQAPSIKVSACWQRSSPSYSRISAKITNIDSLLRPGVHTVVVPESPLF
jgi:hypothetical protein